MGYLEAEGYQKFLQLAKKGWEAITTEHLRPDLEPVG